MKSFAFAIYSPPKSNGAAQRAFELANALVAKGQQVSRLFFFADGVYNAIETDKNNSLPQLWSQWIQEHNVDAVVCVASAQKRGIRISANDDNTENNLASVLPGFAISGLAQLLDAACHSNGVLTFAD